MHVNTRLARRMDEWPLNVSGVLAPTTRLTNLPMHTLL